MMLSRVTRVMLRQAFSTTSITTQSTEMATTFHTGVTTLVPEEKRAVLTAEELKAMEIYAENEKKHLISFINDLKGELRETLELNFAEPIENETVILQTEVGSNNFKIAELLTVGALAKFCQILTGFPSYGAMIGCLGLAGIGAVLSASNHLRRSNPQITSIHLTGDKKLHVYYLSAGLFGNEQKDLLVEPSKFAFTSFGCEMKNFLYKSNETSWYKIDGQLFWLNERAVRINSQLYHNLF